MDLHQAKDTSRRVCPLQAGCRPIGRFWKDWMNHQASITYGAKYLSRFRQEMMQPDLNAVHNSCKIKNKKNEFITNHRKLIEQFQKAPLLCLKIQLTIYLRIITTNLVILSKIPLMVTAFCQSRIKSSAEQVVWVLSHRKQTMNKKLILGEVSRAKSRGDWKTTQPAKIWL